LPPVFQPNPLK